MSDTIKPCPFCGTKVKVGLLEHSFGFAIIHPYCPDIRCIWTDTDGPESENVYETKEECLEMWNMRAY